MTAPSDGGGSAETINAKIPTAIGLNQSESEATIKAKLSTGETPPQQITSGIAGANADSIVLDPSDPLISARKFLAANYVHDGVRTLHHLSGDFYAWTGTYYRVPDDATIRAEVYRFLDKADVSDWNPKTKNLVCKRFKPTLKKVNDVLDAIKAEANLPNTVRSPTCLVNTLNLPADKIIACRNGLLHLPTVSLTPLDPKFFNVNALDFDYQTEACEPAEWIEFLSSLWPDDHQAIEVLQEFFGYLLVLDTSQQKILLIVGPPRSGKGTIGRVITALLGHDNIVAPTLRSMGTNFGLQPLIGKQVAIISDARLGARADQHGIAEQLLRISGEDSLTIDRKFRQAWTGRLPCRFIILTNELPRIADTSGALASRFVVLKLTHSFLGREDVGLSDRLLTELPGILNWAIAGWQRLQARGYFEAPKAFRETMELLEELGSPVSMFVRKRCVVGAENRLPCDAVYRGWRSFCEEQGIDRPGTAAVFGRDLHAAVPSIKVVNLRDGERPTRTRWYDGIGLK